MSFGKKIESRFGKKPPIGPQERIAYHGDIKPLLRLVSGEYEFGDYVRHEVKQNGYEDFNLVLQTTKDTFFIKCFTKRRTGQDCQRYLEIIAKAHDVGNIKTPGLYSNTRGNVLTTITIEGVPVRLCAMQYLDKGNIFESNQPLTQGEKAEVIRQAAKITECKFRPTYVKDSWAIVNIEDSYSKNQGRIDPAEKPIIEDLISQMEQIDIDSLPHSFVHGDIRSTNVMRHSDGQLYIIDFSVANWYPRIVEMAVLCSDILFNPDNPEEFHDVFQWALNEYQQAGITLTPSELENLPLFVRLAHAANVIGASSMDATNYISKQENDHWLQIGKRGLHFSVKDWKP